MRVKDFGKLADWAHFHIQTTYKMSWGKLLAYAEILYEYMESPQITTGIAIGENLRLTDVNSLEDIKKLEERGVLELYGKSKIFEGVPMQFRMYNQSDIVQVAVPAIFVESWGLDENGWRTEEEQKHLLDCFLDSIEINGEVLYSKAGAEAANGLLSALRNHHKHYHGDNLWFVDNGADICCDITELIKELIQNNVRLIG